MDEPFIFVIFCVVAMFVFIGEVVVLVRSLLLRGFDRDTVDRVKTFMLHQGTRIMEDTKPVNIEKLSNGKFNVTFSNGSSEVFDTVLSAIGRNMETSKIGLDTIGVKLNSKNGKVICVNEQTSIPHVYAVGDVVNVSERYISFLCYDTSNFVLVPISSPHLPLCCLF
jgi:thioredoxin reductase (NADPH)